MTRTRKGSSSSRMTAKLLWIIHLVLSIAPSNSWVSPRPLSSYRAKQSKLKTAGSHSSTHHDDLMVMDVVIFSEANDTLKRRLGAVQEDGRITPMCVWTTEPAYGESLEFLVDEEDLLPGFTLDQIVIHSVVPQDALSYGSRQVGGGMGPGNPHGEESELLYYIDRSILQGIEITVNPDLEIFW